MSSHYLSYFESPANKQKEMERKIEFQLSHVEMIGSKLIAKKEQFKQKITELLKMVNETKKKAQRTEDAKHKLKIIYNTIFNEKGWVWV